MAKSLEFKGCAKLGKEKKKGVQKHRRKALGFVQQKSPSPLFYFFFFFHSTSPSLLCVPLVALVQVMTTTLAHCHFAITRIIFGHREEKGKWGACCLLPLMGLWLHCHTTNYNNRSTYYSNVREKKEGGGTPFSNFMCVCVCVFSHCGIFEWWWL